MAYVLRALILPAMLACSLSDHAAAGNEQACKNLFPAEAPNVQILKAQYVQAGPAQKDRMAAMTGAALADVDLPQHCLVQGVIEERTGSDDKPFGIHFEIRMPDGWQQRLLLQGGGLDGFLANMLDRIPMMTSIAKSALTRGYAAVKFARNQDETPGKHAQPL